MHAEVPGIEVNFISICIYTYVAREMCFVNYFTGWSRVRMHGVRKPRSSRHIQFYIDALIISFEKVRRRPRHTLASGATRTLGVNAHVPVRAACQPCHFVVLRVRAILHRQSIPTLIGFKFPIMVRIYAQSESKEVYAKAVYRNTAFFFIA